MSSQFLEYGDFNDHCIRCRSVNNILNYYHRASVNSPFSLSDIDPRNEYVFEVNAALRRIKSNSNTASLIYLTKEIRNLNQVLQDGRVYYPFRISNWDDFSRCTIYSYFVGIRDESRYQFSDNSGTYGRRSKISTLNEDGDFEFRQDIRAALFEVNDDGEANRQQFDSISKDFLSSMSANFDPQRDSFHDNIDVKSYQTFEQKWWSLFGKYWLVKNERNDNDVKMMHWLMTGGNHGMIDTCGENSSLNCDEIGNLESEQECIGSGRLMDASSIDTPAKLLKLELGSQIPMKSPFKLKRDVLKVVQKNNWEKIVLGLIY